MQSSFLCQKKKTTSRRLISQRPFMCAVVDTIRFVAIFSVKGYIYRCVTREIKEVTDINMITLKTNYVEYHSHFPVAMI